MDTDGQPSAQNSCGSVNAHNVDGFFKKAWRELVLDEFKESEADMHKLKMLFVYARCTYRFRAGSLYLHRNYDGNTFRNYGWIVSNRRIFGV
jgi:hypothetical protein